MLLHFAPDYAQVRHENVDAEALASFFTGGVFEKHVFANDQSFDFSGLRGRLLSCSYAPAPGHSLNDPMIQELQRLFEAHEQNGSITFLYTTEVFIGR